MLVATVNFSAHGSSEPPDLLPHGSHATAKTTPWCLPQGCCTCVPRMLAQPLIHAEAAILHLVSLFAHQLYPAPQVEGPRGMS